MTPLEPEQCAKLFTACESHRLGDLIVLAAMTGLRKGELFALHWNAVNLDEGVLFVRGALEELSGGLKVKDPKTSAGRRVVALDSEAIKALRSRLKKAKDEGFELEDVPMYSPMNAADISVARTSIDVSGIQSGKLPESRIRSSFMI